MKTKADIVVPVYEQPEWTVRCFDALAEHTAGHRLVWVDNGSADGTVERIMPSFSKHGKRSLMRLPRNVGFVQGVNSGLDLLKSMGRSEYTVLLNNDVEVTDGWLDRLIGVLEANPKLGAAGPITDNSCVQSVKGLCMPVGHGPVSDLSAPTAEVAEHLRAAFGGRIVRRDMLAFFCVVFRTSVVEQVGNLDPQFGFGLGDDDDYCRRILQAGWKLAVVPSVFVRHGHRVTLGAVFSPEELRRHGQRNLDLLRRKHGG